MSAFDSTIGFMTDPFGGGSKFGNALGKSLGTDNNESVDDAIASLLAIQGQANGTSSANRKLYDQYLQQMQGMYGQGASGYADAVKRLGDAIEKQGDFSYSGEVNDFMDPAAQQRASAAMNAIESSASAGGNRFSSNYLDKLAAKQQALASDEWKSAYDRLMADRQQQLQQWQTGQQKINNLASMAQLYGNDRNQLADAIGNYYSNIGNQNNADLEVASDIAGGKANLEQSRKGGMASVLGGVGGGIGSVIGGIFG